MGEASSGPPEGGDFASGMRVGLNFVAGMSNWPRSWSEKGQSQDFCTEAGLIDDCPRLGLERGPKLRWGRPGAKFQGGLTYAGIRGGISEGNGDKARTRILVHPDQKYSIQHKVAPTVLNCER